MKQFLRAVCGRRIPLFMSFAALVFCAGILLGDGKVTTPPPQITEWKLATLTFPLLNAQHSAVVQVAYVRSDGTVDHVTEHSIAGADYASFLDALGASLGSAEAPCVTGLDTYGNPIADRACVLNLRLSNWLVGHGVVSNATAEPLPSTATTATR